MAVWAFACKIESSLNRWFDGTDQDVYFKDSLGYDITKNKIDPIDALDEQRKVLYKYISQVRSGLGTALFNETQFNVGVRRLSDFDDAIFMQENINIDLSRAIVRLNDIIHPVEYFNKEISFSKVDSVDTDDSLYGNISDGTIDDGFVEDNSFVSDVTEIGLTKTIQYDATDSVSFIEYFTARIGGKSICDLLEVEDSITKEFNNEVGDEGNYSPFNSFLFNELIINGSNNESTVITVVGLTEEVQIIVTGV